MMEDPTLLKEECFQNAWLNAVQNIFNNGNQKYNFIVQIQNVNLFDENIHRKVQEFCLENNIMGPRHVAYTIFPNELYERAGNAVGLYRKYNRPRGLYERTMHRTRGRWGTYFRRMTYYETKNGVENQLDNIITAINNRKIISRAAYTIVIQCPGSETTRKMGAPCLNYINVQLHPGPEKSIGLLCLYRNQEYLERAYGNFWGLCNLLKFLSRETFSQIGPLTIMASHAFIKGQINIFKKFIRGVS